MSRCLVMRPAPPTAVGTLLGYGLDVWLHCSPWGLIGGLILGTITGTYLMLQGEKRKNRHAPTKNETNDNA